MSGGASVMIMPDETAIDFSKLVSELQDKETGIQLKDRKRRLTTYKNCFVGSDFVDWVCKRLSVSRLIALNIGNKMLADNYLEPAISNTLFSDSKFFYRWCRQGPMKMQTRVEPLSAYLSPLEYTDSQSSEQFKLGIMKILCNKKKLNMKTLWVSLERANLHIYPDEHSARMCIYEKKLTTVPLNTITKVVKKLVDHHRAACSITTGDPNTCMMLMHQDTKETVQWVLALDGLLYPSINATSMNPFVKMSLLQSLYFDGWKGGYIKSSYDQEWSYTADGMVVGDVGVDDTSLKFVWNGETLVPNAGPNVGFGHWNGVRAAWVLSQDRPVKDLVYLLCQNEYKCLDGSHSDWVWTKSVFLASKSGEGEWITEGSVPPPIVFLLQLFRYYCLSKATPVHFNHPHTTTTTLAATSVTS